jgi:hypothetical protein
MLSSMANASRLEGAFNAKCVLPTTDVNFIESYENITNINTDPPESKDNMPTVYFVNKDGYDVYLEGYYCKFTSVKAHAK